MSAPHAPRLACHRCDWAGPLSLGQACPRCGASLRVAWPAAPPSAWDDAARGVWRYRARLPVGGDVQPVTLGEGATPLVELTAAPVRVLLKLESANPTLSFKDRPVAVAATVARDLGAPGLLCASTGNTAVAVAAYAARAALPAVCLMPAGTPLAKLALATAAGARVLAVEGDFSAAHALAGALAERSGWANLTSTYLNPCMLEGDKTLAFELVEQLAGAPPDAIVIPVGAGPLLGGIAQGLDELGLTGVRLHAIQAAGCAPIARAFATGAPVTAWEGPVATAAGSIADPLHGYAADGQRTLDAVRASGGAAVAVDDDALRVAAAELARGAGLSVELGAAAALAGLVALRAEGRVADGATVVLVLTGHGAKDHAATAPADGPVATVTADDIDGARRALEEVAHG